MKLQQFNGGLNTRLAPQMLQQHQGVEYTNIDVTKGTLLPEADKLATGILTDKYATYFEADDEWVSSTTETEYLEFRGVLYSTDGVKPKKYSNGVSHDLGIPAPTTAVTLEAVDAVKPLVELTALNTIGAGNLPSSDLSYLVVNYKNDIAATPYLVTVYGSATSATRADGEYLVETTAQINELTSIKGPASVKRSASTITTKLSALRTVTLSEFKGELVQRAEIYRRYKGTWHLLAIITDLTDVVTDYIEDISANAEIDVDVFSAFNGTYQYVYTYYNSTDGTESAPSPVSEELEAVSGEITISGMTSSDPQADTLRLYRVGGSIAQFSLVAELTNTAQVYTDKLKDSEIDARLLASDNYYEAPSDLRYISESYAVLFGAVGSTLRFTPIAVPNAWPPEYSLEFDSTITGLGPVANGLLVMTKYKTYIVTGTGPTSLAQQSLRGDQGCVDFRSIKEVMEGMLVWASVDGLCVSSGNNVKVITKSDLGQRTLTPVDSAVVDEVYYCLDADGTTLAWDYRFSPIYKELQLGVEAILAANSELYGWSEGQQYLLFKGANKLELTYKSPRYTEGSLTLPKTYKKFYFRHKGDIMVNILIDDVSVAVKELTGTNTTEFLVPQDKQRGFYVQFLITGTGELEEIEYTVGKQRNG